MSDEWKAFLITHHLSLITPLLFPPRGAVRVLDSGYLDALLALAELPCILSGVYADVLRESCGLARQNLLPRLNPEALDLFLTRFVRKDVIPRDGLDALRAHVFERRFGRVLEYVNRLPRDGVCT